MRMAGALCALLLAAMPVGVRAADEIAVATTVHRVDQVTNEAGRTETRLLDAARVAPGDELAYTITFENVSEDVTVDAGSVIVTNPIPPEVVYLERTAAGAGTKISFSADDGRVFGRPDQLRVTEASGTGRRARPSEYTHIRWVFEPALEPGQRSSVSFRARLR